jgi:hypothetical protein
VSNSPMRSAALLLVSRPHVDLGRVASALCPALRTR